MYFKNYFYIKIIILTLLLTLIVNDNLVFEPWSQIKYYATYDWLNARSIMNSIPHLPRFSIVYPCYFINEIFRINLNLVYGIYIISILFLTGIFWQRISKYLNNSNIWQFFCSLIPLSLSFIINGRFAFGLLGISLIIYKAYYRKYENPNNNNFIIEFIGLYLSTVSSGTFFFGLSIFLIINSKIILKSSLYQANILTQLRFNKKNTLKNIFETLYTLLMIILFIMFTIKNFAYYGGFNINGINGLLSHGIGALFSRESLIKECINSNSSLCDLSYLINSNQIMNLFIIFISLIFLYLLVKILKTGNLNYFAKLTIIFSLMSGVFGFTAFLSIIVIIPQLRIFPFSTINLKFK